MKIEMKNIKKFVIITAFLLFFSLGYYVFASVNEATNKNFLLDSDQDGLTDEEEKTYGTDPYKADTDKDGYSDGVEVKSGYDPKKPAPGDRLASVNKEIESKDAENLTLKLTEGLKPLLENSGEEGKQVSVQDIDNVLQNSLGNDLNTEASFDSLPSYTVPEDKIMRQNYGNLSEADRKERVKEDTMRYLGSLSYVLANNMPEGITGPGEMKTFVESLGLHINDLAKTTPDYSFYVPIGKHVQAIVDEAGLIQVPENMLEVHTKGIRIFKAYLDLGEKAPVGSGDPVAQITLIKKIQALTVLSEEYLNEAYLKVSGFIAGDKK